MKNYKALCCFQLFVLAISVLSVGANDGPLKYRGKMGFFDDSDSIAASEFVKDGSKLVLIGQKNIQIWDAKGLKLIRSVPHSIDQFAPAKGFFSKYVLLGLPKILNWRPYLIDPDGKWLATIEKDGNSKLRTVIVRDLKDLGKISELKVDDYSARYISFDESKKQIFGVFDKEKSNTYVVWDSTDLKQKRSYVIDDYKWHQEINDGKRLIVGSGDSKFALNIKQGESLTLRDVETGNILTTFTAKDLKPETSFQETQIIAKETLLVAKRDDRLFVWDINGDGNPQMEIPVGNPKGTYSYQRIINDRFIYVKKEGSIFLFDIFGNKDQPIEFAAPPKDSVHLADITDDNRFVAVQDDDSVRVFEIGKTDPVLEIKRDSPKERLRGVAFIEEYNLFAVGRVNNAEKKPFKTYLYDMKDFTLSKTMLAAIYPSYHLIQDKKYFYSEGIGRAYIWDMDDTTSISFDIKTGTTTCSDNEINCTSETYNAERLLLNGDQTLMIKTGSKVSSVWDLKDGKLLQYLFDKDNVKYDKKQAIKDSGISDVYWSDDFSFAYSTNKMGVFFNSSMKVIHVWDVVK